jgi:hypothetical protein
VNGYEETKHIRKIVLHENVQDPVMMKSLQRAINKLNELEIRGPQGKIMIFGWR